MTRVTSYCRTVLDRADVGYAVTDARGNLLWCNRALGAVLGVAVEQAYGRSLPALPVRVSLPLPPFSTVGEARVARLPRVWTEPAAARAT